MLDPDLADRVSQNSIPISVSGKSVSGAAVNNKKLSTLSVWGPYFTISLGLMVTSFSTESSVILNFGIDGDQQFSFAPRIAIQDKTLKILSPVGNASLSVFDYSIEKNRWYQIQIIQNQTNYKVSID